jgi:hypothetical protein
MSTSLADFQQLGSYQGTKQRDKDVLDVEMSPRLLGGY